MLRVIHFAEFTIGSMNYLGSLKKQVYIISTISPMEFLDIIFSVLSTVGLAADWERLTGVSNYHNRTAQQSIDGAKESLDYVVDTGVQYVKGMYNLILVLHQMNGFQNPFLKSKNLSTKGWKT